MPQPIQSELKAERIQSKLKAERIQEKLKAERIQSKLDAPRLVELLAEVPGWEIGEDGRSLRRGYRFPTPSAAGLFAQLAAEVGAANGRTPSVHLRAPEVLLTVPADPKDGIGEADFRLARRLDGRG